MIKEKNRKQALWTFFSPHTVSLFKTSDSPIIFHFKTEVPGWWSGFPVWQDFTLNIFPLAICGAAQAATVHQKLLPFVCQGHERVFNEVLST